MDLVVLVPGKDEREAIATLLSIRRRSLGIRSVEHRILVHPRRDPGCFLEAPAVLEGFSRTVSHALVLFDLEGCGQEDRSAPALEEDLRGRLARAGWDGRAGVVVVEPEFEIWLWSGSPHVDTELGWVGREKRVREWLQGRGLWSPGEAKPRRPKEAVEAVLEEVRLPRSSALYGRLAAHVSLQRCEVESFRRFREQLRSWFPEAPAPLTASGSR